MKLTRRFLAMLLAFSMCFSMVSPAFASEVETVAETEAVVEEIAEVEAEAANEAEEASSEASEEAEESSESMTEASDETTEASEEEEPVGSEANPAAVEFAMNDDNSEGTAVVTVPANTIYYCYAYGIGGKMMSINGGEAELLTGNPRMPVNFSLTNDTDAEAEFVITVFEPAGSWMNPDELVIGENTATVAEGSQGYYYTYIADAHGMVTLTIAAEPGWTYVVNNLTTGIYGDNQWSDSDPVVNPAEVIVNKGDEVQVIVGTYDAENPWTAPAGDVTVTVEFVLFGTETNPAQITFTMNEEGTEGTAAVTVPAHTTYYCQSYGVGGMVLSINGVEYGTLVGNPNTPAEFTVINETDTEAVFVLTVSHPTGSFMNPAKLAEGETTVSVEANTQGYYFTYTAADTGVMTMAIAAEPGWSYVINNLTSGIYGDTQWNDSDPVVNPAVIDVAKGDELQIIVNTYDPADEWNLPAGDITLTVSFEAAVGSESNPVPVEFTMNEDYSEGTATVTVPANSTYYFQSFGIGGMMLSVNGVEQEILVGNPRVPAVFGVTNDTDAEAEFTLMVSYPAGSQMKPAELADGETTVTVAAGTQGYYFTYTAADRGVVTMGIAAEPGWTYVVNNMTTYSYGDTQWSDSDPVVNPAEITVNKGDELQIIVNTYDAANPWGDAPAGDITLTVAFEAAYGSESNPIYPEWEMDENNEINYTVTVPANTTNYYCAYGINGMLMSINGGELVEMVAQGMGRVPVNFTITNDTDAEANYVLHLEYPAGSSMNPAELNVEGQNVVHAKEGDWNGYNYSWIAPADGQLTITMSNGKAGWFYVMNNLTAGIYGDNHYSSNGDAASETIAVSVGDEIAITINSCGVNENDIPAGVIYFDAIFTETVGIESNPALVEFVMNENYSEGSATVIVPANTTYYCQSYGIGGMLMSINGGEPEMLAGNPRMPVYFTLTNDTDAEAEYVITVSYAAGTQMNPQVLTEGETVITRAEGDAEYYLTYIAADKGTVTFDISTEEGLGWFYVVNNPVAGIYGDSQWSDSDPVVNPAEISVNKGDELQIIVNTYDAANMWVAPAGDITVNISFEGAEGTESNPIQLNPQEDYYYHIYAGETVYYTAQGVGDMEMYVLCPEGTVLEMNGETYVADKNNVIVVQMPAAPMDMPASQQTPVVFSITNTYFETDFISGPIWFDYPVGSEQNPQYMTLGKKNTANVEAGDMDGYLFTWTATGNGVLEITMNTGKNWTYSVTNLTAGIKGDIHLSDDVPVVKKEYIAVNTGDEIQIMVNTYDPADMRNSPAGKIEFTPKLIESHKDMLLAGKNVTLKVLDPTNGKAVSASKITWSELKFADDSLVPAEAATLKAGKLTAAKTIIEPTIVKTTASYVNSLGNEAAVEFVVTIYPAASSVTILVDGEEHDGKTVLNLVTNDYRENGWPSLSAVVGPEGAMDEVIWKSSNTKAVYVYPDGTIEPMGNKGSATITATAADGSGKKATVKINVTTEVTQIDVVSKNDMYFVGAGKALTMIANTNPDAVNQKVTWSIKMWDKNHENLVDVPKEIATINSSGKLTAGKGLTDWYNILVIATAQDGSGVVGETEVTVQPIAASVEINGIPENNTFDMNTLLPEFKLGAEVLDAEGNSIDNNVTWKSSSDKIATISEDGTVFCVKPGTVTFTATANDGSGKKAAVKVTIVKSPTEVLLPSRVVVAAGKTADLSKAEVLESGASNKKLTWTFDDPEAAAALGVKVSNGKVSTNAKLITEPVELSLTATAVLGGASATTIIMIYPATKSVSIMSNGAAVGKSVDLTSGDSIVLYAENEPVNAAGRYSWTSSNENVAAVEYNPDGSVTVKVHALKTSKATITATAVDGTNKKASVTLNVVADVDALGLDSAVVLSGKSVKMNSNLFFLDWNSEYEYYDIVTPVSKTVTWTLSLADYSDGTGNPSFIPCENNECYAGTLNAKTGVFTAAKVTEAAYCFVTATYIDEDGNEIVSNGAQITVTPVALKGIDIIGCEGAWDEAAAAKITGKTVSTATGRYVLDVKPTNPEGDPVHYMWWIDLSDWENFTTEWEEILVEEYDEEGNLLYSYTNNVPVIVPVNDGDPYGTVKVTVIAEGGATKKATATIKFVAP